MTMSTAIPGLSSCRTVTDVSQLYPRLPKPVITLLAYVVLGTTVPNALLLIGPQEPLAAKLLRSQFGTWLSAMNWASGSFQVRVVLWTIEFVGLTRKGPTPDPPAPRLCT